MSLNLYDAYNYMLVYNNTPTEYIKNKIISIANALNFKYILLNNYAFLYKVDWIISEGATSLSSTDDLLGIFGGSTVLKAISGKLVIYDILNDNLINIPEKYLLYDEEIFY